MRKAGWGVIAMLAWAGTAQAAVKDAAPNGFTIENQQVVPVDAAAAWIALTADVDRWWPKDHTWWGKASMLSIQPFAGGCFCEVAGQQQAQHLMVSLVDPGKTLRMLGGLGPLQGMGLNGTLEFRLAPVADGGTRITLYYRVGGYTPDDLRKLAPVVDKVTGLQLGGLADYLRKQANESPLRMPPAKSASSTPTPKARKDGAEKDGADDAAKPAGANAGAKAGTAPAAKIASDKKEPEKKAAEPKTAEKKGTETKGPETQATERAPGQVEKKDAPKNTP